MGHGTSICREDADDTRVCLAAVRSTRLERDKCGADSVEVGLDVRTAGDRKGGIGVCGGVILDCCTVTSLPIWGPISLLSNTAASYERLEPPLKLAKEHFVAVMHRDISPAVIAEG